jgi:tRNA A-37 threonylcarbamoyl transferase component Bud32
MKLINLNINTPKPIGYIEFYKFGLLKQSFFVSLHQPYDFLIREPLYDNNFTNRINIIKQFANFTYNLHQQNIFHKDYSAGNILVIKKDDDQYDFSIVDINRMEFRDIDIDTAMENFNKLWADENSLIIIAKQYSKIANIDEIKAIELIIKKDKQLKEFVLNRRKWKKRLLGK